MPDCGSGSVFKPRTSTEIYLCGMSYPSGPPLALEVLGVAERPRMMVVSYPRGVYFRDGAAAAYYEQSCPPLSPVLSAR